ncbi:MAG TPA: hypothetical protein VLF93_02170 [Candidatus Saccharimonadales bacterium]|nr:hypothetical protein [Candidatus Saccharimonadales bacterium]
MSAEAPVRQKKKLDLRVVTPQKDRPGVQQTEALVGKEGVLLLGVPVEILKTDLSLLGSSMITKDSAPPLRDSNPDCHNTRPQSCATCPDNPCSFRACSNPCK